MKYKVAIRDDEYGTIKGTLDDNKIAIGDLFWAASSLAHCIGANLTMEIEMPSKCDLPEATE